MKSNLVKLNPCMGVTALLMFTALAITVQKSAQSQTIDFDLPEKGHITTFDGPGSFATYPEAINPAGAFTGYYFDTSNVTRGFLGAGDGEESPRRSERCETSPIPLPSTRRGRLPRVLS